MADVLTHDSCKNVSCYVFMYSLLFDESHALATDCALDVAEARVFVLGKTVK